MLAIFLRCLRVNANERFEPFARLSAPQIKIAAIMKIYFIYYIMKIAQRKALPPKILNERVCIWPQAVTAIKH